MALPPAPGTKLPDFTLKLSTREGVSDWTLSQNLGKPLVFTFFPLAFSGICAKEICEVRDNLGSLEATGAKVYGLSADNHFANAAFAKEHNAPQGILSDPNREVIGRIWPTMTVAGVANVAKRGAMVVRPDGTVAWASASDDPKVWVGSEEILRHI